MAKTHEQPVRNMANDRLLTPENCVIALIDYQDTQFNTVTSASKERIILNVRLVAEAAARWNVPIVVSTVGVDMGVNGSTIDEIMRNFPDDTEQIDRTGVNAWEDADFRSAIESTGRNKVIIGGLWTEVCVAEPTLDLLQAGYEVYPVIDAIGGISKVAHDSAVTRVVQNGAQPITALAFASELMRDWARPSSQNLREIFGWYFPAKQELDTSGK